MRTEAILKEAQMFNRSDECYIHVERTQGGYYSTVMSGDPVTVNQAIFNLMCRVEDETGFSFKDQLKLMKRTYKKFGPHKPVESAETED